MNISKAIKFGCVACFFGSHPDRYVIDGYDVYNSIKDRIRMISQVPDLTGVDLDVGYDITLENLNSVKELLNKYNLTPAAITADTNGDRKFALGSILSPDKDIQKMAMKNIKDAIDIAAKINCEIVNLWFGQDGYDYCFQVDYMDTFKKFKKILQKMADYNPGITIAIEYKPKEPRKRLFIASAAITLIIIKEVNRPNLGINLDTGHAFNAGENISETLAFLKVFGDRLRYIHLNDNYKVWDDDMMVGSIHLVETLEFLYWLEKVGYKGFYTLDLDLCREDKIKAAEANIAIIKKLREVIERFDENEINKIFSKNDSVSALAMIKNNLIK